MSAPLPILMCGKEPQVVPRAIAGLKPELDVIHSISSVSAGISELPLLVRGLTPPTTISTPNPGSGAYGTIPVAILAGGLFDDAEVEAMRDAILKEAGPEGLKIPWFRADLKRAKAVVGTPEYAREVAVRSKQRVREVLESGEGRGGGVFWY